MYHSTCSLANQSTIHLLVTWHSAIIPTLSSSVLQREVQFHTAAQSQFRQKWDINTQLDKACEGTQYPQYPKQFRIRCPSTPAIHSGSPIRQTCLILRQAAQHRCRVSQNRKRKQQQRKSAERNMTRRTRQALCKLCCYSRAALKMSPTDASRSTTGQYKTRQAMPSKPFSQLGVIMHRDHNIQNAAAFAKLAQIKKHPWFQTNRTQSSHPSFYQNKPPESPTLNQQAKVLQPSQFRLSERLSCCCDHKCQYLPVQSLFTLSPFWTP
jgi:hypothetical protein